MKIKVSTPLLLTALTHANSVASSKSTKPVLECVQIRADLKTGVTLGATDLDLGLRTYVEDAEVEQPGNVVVPSARLLSIVREVDDDLTVLSATKGILSINTGTSNFELRCETHEEFPELSGFPESVDIEVDAVLLQRVTRRTVFACAKDAGRFAMHGVQISVQDKDLRMVATDGRRLARCEVKLDKAGVRPLETLVGPRALALFDRIQGDGSAGMVEVSVGDRQLHIRFGQSHIVSRLIEGTFPATDGVIPQDPPFEMTARVGDLAAGLRRAALLTTRDATSVEFLLDPDALVIRSRAIEVGRAQAEVPVRYEGEPLRIGFNPAFFQEGLRVMDPAAEVTLGLKDAKSPARLSDEAAYVYVLSPISLE